ncbi:MAG: DUF4390 domain-containing protein [Burkholderiales bacterium]|nr:DUF4390 domain-containing protein [Burkholderiales bacterium]OUT78055.1 MAG: hypothetical protein CBB82_04400 [Betaproteobacteria bacterium TMED22]|tara:strand:+ start:5970 stop:6554 length:585 start_codon:yes stop_codon:yes gene_type:complete
MDFFTHFLRKSNLVAVALSLVMICVFATHGVAAGIIVQSVKLEQKEATYSLDATFNIDLSPIIQEALHKGVTLPFVLDFNVVRKRWNIWDQTVVETSLPYRLTFSALTRQYHIKDKLRGRDVSFDTLEQALTAAGAVSDLAVFNAEQLQPDLQYEAQVRLRLEAGGLPSALQLEALESDKWEVSSPWYRWVMGR